MTSPKTLLILLLAATTIGGAIVVWRQHGELVELRAAALNRDERADLQKRVWDLEKRNRELQARSGSSTESRETIAGTAPDDDRPSRERGGRGERGGPGGRGDIMQRQFTAMQELMSKPEVQAMVSQQVKAGIDARYGAFFKNLNLPPEQAEKVKALLAERATTMQDVMSASREQGINLRENPDALRKLITDAQNDINQSIKGVIGEQGLAQLTNYEQTLPQRNVVNELQQRLSYTPTPLTAAQAEQMVQILAANAPAPTATTSATSTTVIESGRGTVLALGPSPGGPPGRGGDFGGFVGAIAGPAAGMMAGMDAGRGAAAAPVTTTAVNQAQGVLSPPQVAALQQIQQQQQTQQQLRQLVNDTLSATQPRPAPPPPGTAPGRKGGG